MKNTFGNNVSITLFGESHGEAIGAVIDGLAPGIQVNEDNIRHQLSLRRPSGAISTSRVEKDNFKIISGVFGGYTTGAPICIMIPNENTRSTDYEKTKDLMRPGHADYTAECKYHGFQDFCGGGHFSGRLTAAVVAAGAIAIDALKNKGILIGTHVKSVGEVSDREFDFDSLDKEIEALSNKSFATLSESAAEDMKAMIEDAKRDLDSVGGVLETVVSGIPTGVGEPWFDSVEGLISHAMFSIPAIKGVEFGDGFALAKMRGSKANDEMRVKDGEVVTLTNHNGGINGGITNGMPIVFRCAVKPTPSIYKEQSTVNVKTMENATIALNGRHDPAIIHRARVVVDSMTALTLVDLLSTRYGTDWLVK